MLSSERAKIQHFAEALKTRPEGLKWTADLLSSQMKPLLNATLHFSWFLDINDFHCKRFPLDMARQLHCWYIHSKLTTTTQINGCREDRLLRMTQHIYTLALIHFDLRERLSDLCDELPGFDGTPMLFVIKCVQVTTAPDGNITIQNTVTVTDFMKKKIPVPSGTRERDPTED